MNPMMENGMNPMIKMGINNPKMKMEMNPMMNMGMNNPNMGMGMNPKMKMEMNPMMNMGMNNPNIGMGMNPMMNMGMNMGMNPMMNMGMNPMIGMGMNPLVMGIGMNQMMGMMDPMVMGGGMGGMGMNQMMGMMNPMVMGGGMGGMGMNMNMMTKKQIEEYKMLMRYQGYLMGKKMAEEKMKRERGNNPTTNISSPETNNTPVSSNSEITINFIKAGITTKIKINTDCMIAELLNEYSVKTGNIGNFNYKGSALDINDCSTLIEKGMKNGDQIIVS